MNRLLSWAILAASLVVFFAGASAQSVSAQDAPAINSVTIGIDNNFRLGCWTQVRLDITSPTAVNSARLEMEVPDGEGVTSVHVVEGVSIPAGDSSIRAKLKLGRANSDLSIRLLDSDGQEITSKYLSADETPDAVLASRFLVVSLGENLGVKEALGSRKQKADQRSAHLEITDAASLPDEWIGYSGVNLVVVPTSAKSVAASMSEPQLNALKQWVQMGGRLIVSAGADADAVIGASPALAELLPGKIDRVRMQRETSNIEGYAGNTRTLLSAFPRDGDNSFRLPMAALKDIEGSVVLAEGLGAERTATVIRSSLGFGHVVYLATDIDLAPLAKWTDGRRRILGRLIDISLGEAQRDDNDFQFSQLTQIGFSDLTGQLRSALDQFSDISLFPFSWIAILIGAYVLLIGPVDYFLLRRFGKRFQLTWITFPLAVLAASALAYWLTQSWKGQSLGVNEVNIVDIEAESGMLRGMAWSHIFSSSNSKYDCQLEVSKKVFPDLDERVNLTSWQGLPGSNFGGMNTRRVSNTLTSYEIRHDGEDVAQVSALPVSIFGSRSLNGLVYGQIEVPKKEVLTANADDMLVGIVRNPLPVPLKNCRLFFGRKYYPLESLPPDGTAAVKLYSQPKTIKYMLTKSRVDQDLKDQSQPWDRKSFDVERIAEMMMFHKSVGGSSYTSLLHRYQAEVDFTDHLAQERAVLIGRVNTPAMSMLKADDVNTKTENFVRIILPVSRTNSRLTSVSSTSSQ